MAEGNKLTTYLGLDANELLAGLDGVAQAYEEAGGKLLKTLKVFDQADAAGGKFSRTVKVLTDNGKFLTFTVTENAQGIKKLTTSIEHSENSIKQYAKTVSSLISDLRTLRTEQDNTRKSVSDYGYAYQGQSNKPQYSKGAEGAQTGGISSSEYAHLSQNASQFAIEQSNVNSVVKEFSEYSHLGGQSAGQFAIEQSNVNSALRAYNEYAHLGALGSKHFAVEQLNASSATRNFSEYAHLGAKAVHGLGTEMQTAGRQALASSEYMHLFRSETEKLEDHAVKARQTLFQAFPASPKLDSDQLLRLQQNIQTASKSVASGAVTPQEFNQIVQSIQTGTINLQGMSTAAVQVANNVTAVKNAAAGTAPHTTHMLLSFQSLVRIFQVQLLHSFFGDLSRGIQSSIDDAVKLQIRISEIKTITQGAKVSADGWITSLRSVSDAFGLDILDVAEGAYEAISNQIVNASTAMGFLTESAEFARATVSTLGQSVNLLSSILNAFSINALETEHVAAVLFKTIELGRVRAEDMADTVGATARLADQAGVKFEEFAASIAVTTIQGVRFDSANTLMRNVLLKLLKPTDEMRKLFRDWGVESGEAAIATFGFSGVLKKFSEELEKGGIGRLAESLQELRAIQGVVTLAGGDFDAKFAETLDKIGGSALTAKTALEEYERAKKITQETAGFKFEKQQQQFKNVFVVDFGEKFLRELVSVSDKVGELTETFKALADSVVAFSRPLIAATSLFVQLFQAIGKVTSVVGIGSNAFVALSGAIGGAVAAIAALSFVSTITALFGLSAASAAATTAVAALRTGLIALGLSNPFTIGLTIAAAAVGAFYASYSAAQDKLRTLDIDTKNQFLKSIKDVQEAREEASATESALTRSTLEEKFKSHNQAIVPLVKAFNEEVTKTVGQVDDLIGRLGGLPTLAQLLGTKGEDANLSAEAIAETFDKVIKQVAKDVEKSLDLSDKLKIGAANQNFKESLVGLSDLQVITAYRDKYNDLIDKAKEASVSKDAETARTYFGEASDVLEDIASKRFDLFKETKKSIEDSIKLTKTLTETFEEKQFNRSIEGKSDKTQSTLFAKKAREARQEGLALGASGDYEGARAKFELADTFYDKSIDKLNAINKKKKSGRGSGAGTKGLLAEEEALYKERLALDEKFRKEQEEKQSRNADLGKTVEDARNKLLEAQLGLEERFRKGLDKQLEKQSGLIQGAKDLTKAHQELLAVQKEITEELDKQKTKKSNSEQERTGALTDFYGAATQYAQAHSVKDPTTPLSKRDSTVFAALNEIPDLIQKAQEIESNKTIKDKDRYTQVRAIQQQIKDRINIGQDYDTQNGVDREKRRIGDHSQANLEQRIGIASDKASSSTRAALEATKDYEKLKTDLSALEKSAVAATEAETKKVDMMTRSIAAMEKLNESFTTMNDIIKANNADLPKNQQKPLLVPLPTPAHAAGGLLGGPSPSGPGDNQLIFARTGEFIVNANSTKRFYSQLVAMNNGHMPNGYANGGQVTNNFGGISINVPTGTPAKQTREIASQLRRGLRNKTISLN